jgi:hypothetical protein
MRTPIYGAVLLSLAIGSSSCSAPGAESRRDDTVKVEGCLSGADDGRVVLTAAPDAAVSAAARVGTGPDRETHSYVLVGGDNLQAHFGRRVEVSGTLIGKERELEHDAKSTQSVPAANPDRERQPTVSTKEEIDVEIRQLSVASVRDVAPTCQVNR